MSQKNKIQTKKNNSPRKDAEETRERNEKQNDERNEKIKEQLELEKDRILRLSAEFENYKKRKQKEIDEFKKFANETVFRQILTIADNLERAITSAGENPDGPNLLEGVKLTHRKILKLFDNFNVKPVEAEKKIFNPNFHQAVTQEENDEFPDNTVIAVLQKGYLLNERLIRPAMVIISKKKN